MHVAFCKPDVHAWKHNEIKHLLKLVLNVKAKKKDENMERISILSFSHEEAVEEVQVSMLLIKTLFELSELF